MFHSVPPEPVTLMSVPGSYMAERTRLRGPEEEEEEKPPVDLRGGTSVEHGSMGGKGGSPIAPVGPGSSGPRSMSEQSRGLGPAITFFHVSGILAKSLRGPDAWNPV